MNILEYSVQTSYPAYPAFPAGGQTIINTINPNSYCVARKDIIFREALQKSDLYPDGVGIVIAAKFLHGSAIHRITGSDLHLHLLNEAQKSMLKVFYLGAGELTLQKISERISHEFPSVKVAVYSPPFKPEFSAIDNQKMIDAVNHFAPDILFVGMTAPKQEKWVYHNMNRLKVPVICSVGAVFDFYAGTVKRPAKFWIKLGLEWLPRFLREPRRLWRRNFIMTPLFVWYLLVTKAKQVSDNLNPGKSTKVTKSI
jgi:N-acetylglucosaminyldiphosphoundecaprenol N-acetyl-beta-D-mannosaminyltransferase